jgi:hypothetical protein
MFIGDVTLYSPRDSNVAVPDFQRYHVRGFNMKIVFFLVSKVKASIL